MRSPIVVAAALSAGLALGACGTIARNAAPSAAQIAADFKGSPAPLAQLHAQSGEILGGGVAAFKRRLRALRGYPVVVNKWGSWCPPCQLEFPIFQRVSAQLGRRVAFLGDDAHEPNIDAGADFLRRFPVTYPSFSDPNWAIAGVLDQPTAQYTPVTYFYNARGQQVEAYIGQYLSAASLLHDIYHYLGA